MCAACGCSISSAAVWRSTPENAGTPYQVLLGLLGRDIYERGGCYEAAWPLQGTATAYRSALGCPTWSFPYEPEGVRAVQPLERRQDGSDRAAATASPT